MPRRFVKEPHSFTPQVDKEKESLRFELNKTQAQVTEAESAIASQKAEIEKLNHIITEADSERLRQKKEYDVVINERDILGTQVRRRQLMSARTEAKLVVYDLALHACTGSIAACTFLKRRKGERSRRFDSTTSFTPTRRTDSLIFCTKLSQSAAVGAVFAIGMGKRVPLLAPTESGGTK